MQTEILESLFDLHKEQSLFGRYIQTENIYQLLNNLDSKFVVETLGVSVLNTPIFSISCGDGESKILMWSQMHGNESTTTKALFDLLNFLQSDNSLVLSILKKCRIKIIPILNPDGAEKYTRLNANAIDLNRDAQYLNEPESRILRNCFDNFKPDFCFNLHGQRTIFGAGKCLEPATVSFLAPAQDIETTVSTNRKIAMQLINAMNNVLQEFIPGKVGIYDDTFNLNCVGDTFQSLGIPTILFEAGHFPKDYQREHTRTYMFYALVTALDYISNTTLKGEEFKSYFNIPMNAKCFYDIIIRDAKIEFDDSFKISDIAIQYEENLIDKGIEFIPKIVLIDNLKSFKGHLEIKANNKLVKTAKQTPIYVGYENDFVFLNNEKLSLKLT